MATKTKVEVPEEDIQEENTQVEPTAQVPDPYERVPYELPIKWDNPRDNIQFVSVGDYTADIQRGVKVMIPRYVAEFLDRQQEDERKAKMAELAMQEEYRAKAKNM